MRLAATAVGALLLGSGLLACGEEEAPGGRDGGNTPAPPVACTEIGCGPALYLDVRAIDRRLPQAESVRFCLDDACRRFDLSDQIVAMDLDGLQRMPRVPVRMVVLAEGGRALLRRSTNAPVRRSFPNGPECPPPCFSIAVELQPVGLELIGAY